MSDSDTSDCDNVMDCRDGDDVPVEESIIVDTSSDEDDRYNHCSCWILTLDISDSV